MTSSMDVVLVCCHQDGPFQGLSERIPFCLLPVGNRPLVEHCLDHLAWNKCQRIFLLQDQRPELLRSTLKGGKWGIEITCLPVPGYQGIGDALLRVWNTLRDRFLLCGQLYLSQADFTHLFQAQAPPVQRVAYQGVPIDILCLYKASIQEIVDKKICSFEEFLTCLNRKGVQSLNQEVNAPVIAVHDLESYWSANQNILNEEFRPWFVPGKEYQPGVRAGKGTTIHPKAMLTPPVLLGENIQVETDVQLGPNVIVDSHCLLEKGVQARHCIIGRETYVGKEIELDSGLVWQEFLIRYPQGVVVRIPDRFILGSTSGTQNEIWRLLLHKSLALGALALSSPVVLFVLAIHLIWPQKKMMTVQSFWSRKQERNLSIDSEDSGLIYLPVIKSNNRFVRFLPALFTVLQGKIALVGVELLSPEDVPLDVLQTENKRIEAMPGLVNPWHGLPSQHWDWAEKRVMEIYYSQTRSLKEDCKILRGYCKRMFFSGKDKPEVKAESDGAQ